MYLLELPSPSSSVTSMTIQKNRVKIIFSLLSFGFFFFFSKIHNSHVYSARIGSTVVLFLLCVFGFFPPGHFKTSLKDLSFLSAMISDGSWGAYC